MGVLYVVQLIARFFYHTPYESFCFLPSDYSTEVRVEKGFEDGEHTLLVDIGMSVTCENGAFFPLLIVDMV